MIDEIGRRLKHVKENDLAHGEFGKWLESVNINHHVANKMMKISENDYLNYSHANNLGSKALYEIATLPEPERTKEHEKPPQMNVMAYRNKITSVIPILFTLYEI